MATKEYYQAHKAERLAYAKAYRLSHREQRNAYLRQFYQDHLEERRDYNRANSKHYYQTHREEQIAKSKLEQKARRDIVRQAKNKPCMDCGVSYPPYVMDLDHRPGVIKIDKVSNLVRYNTSLVMAEIEKCDVVCANCHRIRTFTRMEKVA